MALLSCRRSGESVARAQKMQAEPLVSSPGSASGWALAVLPGWISGPGRPPGKGNGNPLQYSCLTLWSRTRLSD